MDTKFQTSFIPKKNLTNDQNRPHSDSISIFLIISIIVFILSLASAGGVFAYKKILIKNISDMDERLTAAKNSFEPTFIDNASALSKRIEASKKLLTSHTILTPIFDFLENETLATVKFDTLSYSLQDDGSSFLVISGQAKNFSSIALQSDIFGKKKFIKNPIFSDLNPDQSGNIVFKFNSGLEPSFVSYKSNLQSKIAKNN